MNLSSIFSSKTLRIQPGRVIVSLACTLLFLLVIDIALRYIDPVKTYDGWENFHVDSKIKNARKLHSQFGHIDVMLFSSSIGLQTDVSLWTEASGNQVVSYNAAIGGARPQWSRFLFENVYWPETKPSLVIYCISPRDVNGRGYPTENLHHAGPLWESPKARSFLVDGWKDRFFVFLNRTSYLYRISRHVRAYIQTGPIIEDEMIPTLAHGTNLPAVRTMPDDMKADSTKKSIYDRFTMPKDGEFQELVDFAKFCKVKGVEFVLVNQQVAPSTYALFDNPDKDYQTYLNGLEDLKTAGVRVIDMAQDLKLTHYHFGDGEHVNRRGGFLIADYLFEKVVHPIFSEKMIVDHLPQWSEISSFSVLEADNPYFYTQDRSKVPPTALYASPLQAVTRDPGGTLTFFKTLCPGNYVIDLYGADERTTRSSDSKGHQLSWEVRSIDGKSETVPFEFSRNLVQGTALTQSTITIQTTSTMKIHVDRLDGSECVLDTMFVRERVSERLGDAETNYCHNEPYGASEPMFISNSSFEFPDLSKEGYPVQWYPYTRERAPWGTVELVSDAYTGKTAVQMKLDPATKGWGCLLVQDIPPILLDEIKGKTIEVSAWVKSREGRFFGKVDVMTSSTREVRFPSLSKSGEWQKLKVQIQVDDDVRRLPIHIGAITAKPVLVDDVELKILEKSSTSQ